MKSLPQSSPNVTSSLFPAQIFRSALGALREQEYLTLRKLATYHRMLELIKNYETALDIKIYTGDDEENVTATFLCSVLRPTHQVTTR